MAEDEKKLKNAALTFLIGFVAGISPFLFMQLLPSVLNPEAQYLRPNYPAIAITGVLIGAITSILFARHYRKKEPQDIFFYALGIPAILIATISNISSEFNAARQIDDARQRASMTVIESSAPEVTTIDVIPEPVQIDLTPQNNSSSGILDLFNGASSAFAEEPSTVTSAQVARGKKNFLLVIGKFSTKEQALSAYRKAHELKLNTENYAPKNLDILKISDNSYLLIYSRYSSQAEANKTFRLLRINDPKLTVEILSY